MSLLEALLGWGGFGGGVNVLHRGTFSAACGTEDVNGTFRFRRVWLCAGLNDEEVLRSQLSHSPQSCTSETVSVWFHPPTQGFSQETSPE